MKPITTRIRVNCTNVQGGVIKLFKDQLGLVDCLSDGNVCAYYFFSLA